MATVSRWTTSAIAVSMLAGLAFAATPARWNGTTGNYSDPAKWDVGVVPCGAYDVTLPAGIYTVTMDVASCTVVSVSIADNVTFRIGTGKLYDITGNASIAGVVDDPGGTFLAPAAGFAGARARAYVSTAGNATLHAPSYSAAGLAGAATLFSASGTGSILDLTGLLSASDAFDDGTVGASTHFVRAESGGAVRLPNLTTVTVPVRREDALEFDVNGGSIDLSALSTVSGGAGYAVFVAQSGSTLSLPALTWPGTSQFHVYYGGRVELTGAQPIDYSATGFHWASATNPFYAWGTDSVIDAPAVRSISDAFDDGTAGASTHFVRAESGGAVLLPNLTTVAVPVRREDVLEFDVNGGSIDLSALSTVSGGAGYAVFVAQSGSTLSLPALTSPGTSEFHAYYGGRVELAGAQPIDYTATGLYWANGTHPFYVWGTDSVIDAPAVRSISDAFDDGTAGASTHFVRAESGGAVLLPNLTTVAVPVRREDVLEFDVNGGSIDLSALSTVSGGAGYAVFVAQSGSTLSLPALTSPGTSEFQAYYGGRVELAGAQPIDYSATGLFWANGTHPFYAWGTDSAIDAPAVRSISDAFDDGTAGASKHFVRAESGGAVLLPNLTTVTVPVRREDALEFDVNGGSIDLSALSTVSGGAGYAVFVAQSGSTLSLPALTSPGTSVFQVYYGGRVQLAGAQPIDYSAAGLAWANGTHPFYAWGTDSVLDAPAVRSISDAFDDGTAGASTHFVTASTGGAVRFPNLTGVETPLRAEDSLTFDADAGAIDAPSLRQVSGVGRVTFSSSNTGSLALGDLAVASPMTMAVWGASAIRAGGIRDASSAPVSSSISLGTSDVTFEIAGNLELGDDISLTATQPNTLLTIGRSFTHRLTDETSSGSMPRSSGSTAPPRRCSKPAGGTSARRARWQRTSASARWS